MNIAVKDHYTIGDLATKIADALRTAGKDLANLTTKDLAPFDEFHIRGREATLELARGMGIEPGWSVLDIGSGLGGPARTLAETYGCRVTGIDLSEEFCSTAEELSRWVNLSDKVRFSQGDATDLACIDQSFDAATTIHVAMNIAAKDLLYAGAYRVLKPGGLFAIYDVVQGEGGNVLFPVPWAREPSISHLATPLAMRGLLQAAGFEVVAENDSTEASEAWFKQSAAKLAGSSGPPIGLRQFLGADAAEMTRNQVRNLTERRIRTVTFLCRR